MFYGIGVKTTFETFVFKSVTSPNIYICNNFFNLTFLFVIDLVEKFEKYSHLLKYMPLV